MAWSFTVLGGGQEIGANSYLLEINGVSLLLDAGLHPKKYGQESLPDYGWISGELEAIFISHAHLDHVGSLPLINRQQPQASIFATIPTKEIALRMLHNTVTVMNIFREKKDTGNILFSNMKTYGPWREKSSDWNSARQPSPAQPEGEDMENGCGFVITLKPVTFPAGMFWERRGS